MRLLCERCKMAKMGCNNCNHFNGDCRRFQPNFVNRKDVVEEHKGRGFAPDVRNPMINIEEVINDLFNN